VHHLRERNTKINGFIACRESYGEHDDSGASSDTETELASPAPEEAEEEIPFSRTRGVDAIMTHWRDPSEAAAVARRQSGARSVVARAFELMERDPEVRVRNPVLRWGMQAGTMKSYC
jgi:hypothetical protein